MYIYALKDEDGNPIVKMIEGPAGLSDLSNLLGKHLYAAVSLVNTGFRVFSKQQVFNEVHVILEPRY